MAPSSDPDLDRAGPIRLLRDFRSTRLSMVLHDDTVFRRLQRDCA